MPHPRRAKSNFPRTTYGGVTGGIRGVYKYDLTNPAEPVLEGCFIGRVTRWDDQFSCPIGNLIAVADDQQVDGQYVGGLMVFDDTQPDTAGPTMRQFFPKNESSGQPFSSCVSGVAMVLVHKAAEAVPNDDHRLVLSKTPNLNG